MWCLGVLFSQTMSSPKSLRVWLTDPFSRGLWEVKGHCLSFVSAEAQGRDRFISKKYVGVVFVRVNPNKLHRRPTKVLRVFYQQKLPVWTDTVQNGNRSEIGQKGTNMVQNGNRSKVPKILLAGSRLRKLSCRHILSFMKKKG